MRFLRLAFLAACGLGLAGCLDLSRAVRLAWPTTVAGVPNAPPWMALPLRAWVVEGDLAPVAVAACLHDACAPKVAVALYRASDDEARRIEAVLADPDRLRRHLAAGPDRRPAGRGAGATRGRAVATTVQTEPFASSAFAGLALTMARQDGTRAVHAAALASRRGDETGLVLAIGESADAVRQVAREAAAANLR